MPVWTHLKVPLVASVLSLGAGAALVLAFGAAKPKAAARTVTDDTARESGTQAPERRAPMSLPVAALEARIAALETQVQPPEPAADAEPEPFPERPTDEEESRQTRAVRDEQQRAFDAEGYDPAWSTTARSEFSQDLEALAQDKNYRVLNVDCKTTLCKATVEWPSYGEVTNTASDLLYADYRNNCTKMVFAPTPTNRADPYQGTVMYDCTSSRAGD